MKKYFLLLAAGLLLSCSSDDSNDDNGGSSVIEETAQVYKYDDDNPTATPTEKSTISGKVYMVDRDGNGKFIYEDTTMIEIGKVENGILTLDFPQSVDSRFMRKFPPNENAELPDGLTFEPLGVEIFTYSDGFHIINESIENKDARNDNLVCYKIEEKDGSKIYHRITYWYFSKETEMKGNSNNENFNIEAKKGWNKLYVRTSPNENENQDEEEIHYITTNIDEAPNGLVWLENAWLEM